MSTKVFLGYLLCLFFFLLPSQLGKHFWPAYAVFHGTRVDYLAPTFYLTDGIFLVVLCLWLKIQSVKVTPRWWWMGLGILILANTLWALNPWAAMFKWLKIGEVILLACFFARYQQKTFLKQLWLILFWSAVSFSLIGILQVIKGASLNGVFYWLGERTFSLVTPGMALVSWGGRETLRAYSTFSHPNSMAGYLGAVLILLVWQRPRFNLGIMVVVLGMILTASKGVFVSLAIILGLALIGKAKQRYYQVILMTVVWTTLVISLVGLSGLDQERALMIKTAGQLFRGSPILGVGLNNYLIGQNQAALYQPVHNVWILILAETGILGLLLVIFWINFWLKAAVRQKHFGLILVVVFVALTGVVDHYWWTLQQNLMLLALVFGLNFRRDLG